MLCTGSFLAELFLNISEIQDNFLGSDFGGDGPSPNLPHQAHVRLRRHCVINKSKTSEDAVKLWKSKDGRS